MPNAQLSVKIVFWRRQSDGMLVMGMPEQYAAPMYYEKIVCYTAAQAEQWSKKMREQEASRESMKDEERAEIEERIRGEHRHHIQHLMANARNSKNRDFLRYYLQKSDNSPDNTRFKRESYLHSEGYERGR